MIYPRFFVGERHLEEIDHVNLVKDDNRRAGVEDVRGLNFLELRERRRGRALNALRISIITGTGSLCFSSTLTAVSFSSGSAVFLLYAAPALVMLGLHAGIANHYTRYNLILICPFSAGAAWLMASIGARVHSRWRVPSPVR
jgi:hypothetical protein